MLVEAVASGKPVVATRFPHAEELLAGGAGIMVDHGDVEAMAAASASACLYEPGLAERMAAARPAGRGAAAVAGGRRASYRTLVGSRSSAEAWRWREPPAPTVAAAPGPA